MEEVKDNGKVHRITFDGYRIACFVGSKEYEKALEIIQKEKSDAAILSTEVSGKSVFKYVFHIVTYKDDVNVKRLANLLIEQGKSNGLYGKHNSASSEKSAKVFAANQKLLKQ